MKKKLLNIVLIITVVFSIVTVPNVVKDMLVLRNFILLGLGATLLIFLLINYKEIKIDKKDIAIYFFILCIVISTFLSSDIGTSIFGVTSRYEGMLTLIVYSLIYIASKKFLSFKNKKGLYVLLYVIFLPIAILGIGQYFFKAKVKSIFSYLFVGSVIGNFGNTNFMGSFLILGLPIFVIRFIKDKKWLSFATANLLFFDLIACYARSAWVGFGALVIMLLIYAIKQKDKKIWIRAIALGLCFIAIFSFLYFSPNSKVKSKVNVIGKELNSAVTDGIDDKMGSGRIILWKEALKLIVKHPIFGVGTDNLHNGYKANGAYERFNFKTNMIATKAHNEYLQIAATEGIPCLIAYLSLIAMILLDKRKHFFNSTIYFMIGSCIICYLVQAFFNISITRVAPVFWFILGLMDNEMVKKIYNEETLKNI